MFHLTRSWKRAALVLAAAVLFNGSAKAVLPDLPSSAVVSDSFVVVHMDAAKMDGASVDQAVQTLLGPAAGFVAPKVQIFKDELKQMTDAGAESLTVVASGDPESGQPAVIGYVKLKSGTDHAAAQQKIRDEQVKQAQNSGGKAPELDLKDDGDFIVIRDKNGPTSASAPDADLAKKFAGAFPADNKAVTAVFIPPEKMRAKMKDEISKDQNEPAWAAQLGKSISDCQNVNFELSLGDSPTLDLCVQAASDEDAKKLSEAADQGAQQLKTQADQMKQGGAQFAAMAKAMSDLADSLKAKQESSKVTVSVEGKILGPAVANIIPMMLMGGHAGPGPGPGSAPSGGGL